MEPRREDQSSGHFCQMLVMRFLPATGDEGRSVFVTLVLEMSEACNASPAAGDRKDQSSGHFRQMLLNNLRKIISIWDSA